MILIIDHFDSFSYNLYQLFAVLRAEVKVVRCNRIRPEEVLALQPEVIVLSPGPGSPQDTGVTMELLNDQRLASIPFLGVCLGFQALAVAWGGEVALAPEVVHGKTLEFPASDHPLLQGMPFPLTVARYHSLYVRAQSLPSHVEVILQRGEMAMLAKDRRLPRIGMQFHPESFLTKGGSQLCLNCLADFRAF